MRVMPLIALTVGLGLIITLYTGLGMMSMSGPSVESGLSDEVEDTANETQNPNIDPDEGGSGGFLSFAVSALSNLKSLFMVPVYLPTTLQSLGAPAPFAEIVGRGIQIVIGVGLIEVALRYDIT
ncbi:hypothetical protein SAMN06269185_1074 [Natronoarchaeum philippinense]|uniref:Uncharacterized protein n=1 Tax=Natronoarchaeum philippinense TaxID=558529 RepID=A0A285NB84_NATPI|nr:hypothetical protein [Natronoarchaeum philippinense]SNZ06173.1 hypothetical protein SAMN06269185_1074 [Natronoarchaeum philippinense]